MRELLVLGGAGVVAYLILRPRKGGCGPACADLGGNDRLYTGADLSSENPGGALPHPTDPNTDLEGGWSVALPWPQPIEPSAPAVGGYDVASTSTAPADVVASTQFAIATTT
jgi:hypothetical protein